MLDWFGGGVVQCGLGKLLDWRVGAAYSGGADHHLGVGGVICGVCGG